MADEFSGSNWWDKTRFEPGEPSSVSSSQDQKTALDSGDMNVIEYGFQTPDMEWGQPFTGGQLQELLIDQRPQFLPPGNFPADSPVYYNNPAVGSPLFSSSDQQSEPFLSPSSAIKTPPFYFSNNAALWNASTSIFSNPHIPSLKIDDKTTNRTSSSSKRSRNEAAFPLPPFKARKEKMGDRITKLQQLVSPFGKTDTASVLSEVIECIKFLHEQINVLVTPYFHLRQPSDKGFEETRDLRSGGLCLVPVPGTLPMNNENSVDILSPLFMGTFK